MLLTGHRQDDQGLQHDSTGSYCGRSTSGSHCRDKSSARAFYLLTSSSGIAAHSSSFRAGTAMLALKYGIGTRAVNPPLNSPRTSQSAGGSALFGDTLGIVPRDHW